MGLNVLICDVVLYKKKFIEDFLYEAYFYRVFIDVVEYFFDGSFFGYFVLSKNNLELQFAKEKSYPFN